MSEALDHLARLAGIEDGWWDFFGVWRVVPPETKRVFLAAMGLPAATEDEIIASLHRLDSAPWRRRLEPVLVIEEHSPPPGLSVTLPAALDGQDFHWRLEEELGISHSGSFRPEALHWGEERELDGVPMRRRWLELPALPPSGYHRFVLTGPDDEVSELKLIVTPARAFVPEVVEREAGAWGIATQLYALRSGTDWGVGSYGALAELAAAAAKLGAACVGINPLHALFPTQPERFSPYSPSSRRFLNIAYIDVEAIPEFAECREAKRMFASPGFQASLARVRGYRLIEYPDVAQVMMPMLELLHRWFRKTHLDDGDERGRDFHDFQRQGGAKAHQFAVFEALHEARARDGQGYWREWPEDLRSPDSPEVAAFAAKNAERVEFYQWLQFVADRQLAAAHHAGREAGAAIGLYRDLAVGIAGDGGEAWAESRALALGVSVGAPPDPLALKGQDWGLVPFNPITLREMAYEPFTGIMEANMRHAGALRLDHAMSLQRLYWVPPGLSADQGAYVRYPVEDLFRLVALESRRNRCLVIGEDLGTVPEGFRERMERLGLFAYRVMVFEKTEDGRIRPPDAFDAKALAIFATHDLPSARGWWAGRDIAQREKLDLYPRPGQADEERVSRQADRDSMVAALGREGLLDTGFPTTETLTDAEAVALAAAAHAYLGRSRARLAMVQMEDVLGLDLQMNLPGTTTQHPNWRRRLPDASPAILADPRMRATADGLKSRANPPMSAV